MNRFAQKGDYMPVADASCLNLVTAVIDYYKRQPPPHRLKTIYLDHTHWNLFIEDMKKVDDTYIPDAIDGIPIAHSDVTIRRGSMFQQKEMKYEFYDI